MKRWVISLLLLPFGLWLLSASNAGVSGSGFWALRKEGIYLSGIVAYTVMAVAMLLATRPVWLEKRLGGLDRGYRLHKWLGISAGVLVFVHWMMEILPKSLATAGWIDPPVRGPKSAVVPFFDYFRDPAKDIGEWLAYIAIGLVLVALIKYFPYHWFRRVHKIFPAIFLGATFHAVVLLPDGLWPTAMGLWVGLWAVVGSVAAVVVLLGGGGRSRRFSGKVHHVSRLGGDVMQVECRLDRPGLSFDAGQFAFVRFAGTKDPHPFSLASANLDAHHVRFCIKALGDDTRRLFESLAPGSAMQLEGPYGCFDFEDTTRAQVWIGAGVGAAPFVARLEYLAAQREKATATENGSAPNFEVVFFYCTTDDAPMNGILQTLCERAGIELHLVDRARDGALELDKTLAHCHRPEDCSLWYCGPAPLGDDLAAAWKISGRSAQHFHREFFVMR